MPVKKFAISIPEEVMGQVDSAAKKRGITRSRFISDVLRRVAGAATDSEITRRINEVFADPAIRAEQTETARVFQRATKGKGTRW